MSQSLPFKVAIFFKWAGLCDLEISSWTPAIILYYTCITILPSCTKRAGLAVITIDAESSLLYIFEGCCKRRGKLFRIYHMELPRELIHTSRRILVGGGLSVLCLVQLSPGKLHLHIIKSSDSLGNISQILHHTYSGSFVAPNHPSA